MTLSTLCKGCNILFNQSKFLKHISHSKSCKAAYSVEEITEYENWTKRKIDQARSGKRKPYDPKKRAQLYQQNKTIIAQKRAKQYHETIAKFKEKPKGMLSLNPNEGNV